MTTTDPRDIIANQTMSRLQWAIIGLTVALKAEGDPGDPPAPLAAAVADVGRIIDAAMDQLRATPRDSLLDERKVGRAGLPATVLGLLFHAAEHTTRHVGQAITTALIQRP